MKKIGILGTGTWGMALGRMLNNNGYKVDMYSAIGSEIDELLATRHHNNLDIDIPAEIGLYKEVEPVLKDAYLIIMAVPSVFVRSTCKTIKPYIKGGEIIVDVAKGIEKDTLLTMSEIIEDELKDVRVVALSGPTHAEEVSRDLPTTIVSASKDIKTAEIVQDVFMNETMRVYTSEDIKGVEICGALKNIMALAAGACSGLGYGDNTKAALITRGMAEITRLGYALNCNKDTFYGLAGIGDLIVTATSMHSRNNRCGMLMGQGLSAKEATEKVGMVVEGLNALPAAVSLKDKHGIDMPIVTAIDNIVNKGKDPKDEVRKLMIRDKKQETI